MDFVEISGTAITVSRIGLGSWSIGGLSWGGTDEADTVATIQSAIAAGITLIDTAAVYGFGRSEEILGRALAQGALRREVVLATQRRAGME